MIEPEVIGIIGRQGAYGRWLARFFRERMGLVVIGRDPPAGDTALDEAQIIAACDVLVFAAPIRDSAALIADYARIAGGRERRQLWLDVTSIKREPVSAMLASQAEVLGLHPMCAPPKAPTLRGRTLVCCPARLDRWRPWSQRLLAALEAECVEADPGRHDQFMALVQGMVHAVHLAQASVLRQHGGEFGFLEGLWPFRSASFELDLTMAARILSGNPAIYEGIQFDNPAALPVLESLVEQLAQLRDCLRQGDETARSHFREVFIDINRQFFGKAALQRGNHGFERLGYLLADLTEPRTLSIHLIDDHPGSLRDLLQRVAAHGVNLRSIHSSRSPEGEVHFRLGCEDDTDPAALARIVEDIEASGLGRRVRSA